MPGRTRWARMYRAVLGRTDANQARTWVAPDARFESSKFFSFALLAPNYAPYPQFTCTEVGGSASDIYVTKFSDSGLDARSRCLFRTNILYK